MTSDPILELYKHQFAVISLETTGISPQHGDHLIELAIQTVNWNGELLDSYETLVNPGKDIEGFQIHGITDEMVKNAPSISEIAPDILSRLNGKTLVAHDLDFAIRFLQPALKGELSDFKGICTLNLSNLVVPDSGLRRLEQLCTYYDIDLSARHTAKADSLATAKLFSILKNLYNQQFEIEGFVKDFLSVITIEDCPKERNIFIKRKEAKNIANIQKTRLYDLLNRLTSNAGDSVPVRQYLNVLDRALADRILSEKEIVSLVELASDYKLSKDQVMEIHEEYLRKLIRIYLLDEILTNSEMEDINLVSELLCILPKDLKLLIEYERTKIQITTPGVQKQLKSLKGKSVCFSGHLNCKINGQRIDRELAQQLVKERGLIVKRVVSKNVDYLITAQVDSFSAKGRKNRKAIEYHVNVMAEKIFWEMIGVAVDCNE
ncbi:exonuclease domain-containing protein [Labilibaculum sp. K2S]|uniref:exonuclease domain-containing protein n=1 Tax=Labilibaculum sp. K2S TaxID=3056386 RepID=UPI0025A3CDE7|nr:exonuclease domain-containing protein [Labilibaculum sp. K2S]MDM8160839.1 exonuclease domain-containing protein [Labilibaculum sp. K2S]